MADIISMEKALRKCRIDEEIINKILKVDYIKNDDSHQDSANYYYEAIQKAEELLDYDTFAKVQFHRACCKSGYRMENAKNMQKEHGHKPLEERLEILGTLKYMGKPRLNEDGDIETVAVGTHEMTNMKCPCWRIKGSHADQGKMPLNYCLCCAGHFTFHYQKALGLKLKPKKVVSSILDSEGKEPCVFIYEIVK